MKVELYHTSSELKQLFRKEKNARLATRIRAVYLAVMGKSAPEIAVLLGYRRRTIQKWIYSYNRLGLDGLQDTSGRGQRCKLNDDQIQWLRQRLEEGPPPESGLSVFHGKDIQLMIHQQFGVPTTCIPFTKSSIAWATAMSRHVLNIPKVIHKPERPLKKSR